MFDEIIDHCSNSEALLHDDKFYSIKNGNKCKNQTTKGWEIYVQWRNGSSRWISLKELKNYYPMEVAYYKVSNKIQYQPAFAWWVPYTLKKRNSIIKKR